MDERTEKMNEVSVELFKLREMQDPWAGTSGKPYFNVTEDNWMYVLTGKKTDILWYLFMFVGVPGLALIYICSTDIEMIRFSWMILFADVAFAIWWVKEAWETRKYIGYEKITEAQQIAIVKRKIAELKEIDERLKKEELQKKQEESEKSEEPEKSQKPEESEEPERNEEPEKDQVPEILE